MTISNKIIEDAVKAVREDCSLENIKCVCCLFWKGWGPIAKLLPFNWSPNNISVSVTRIKQNQNLKAVFGDQLNEFGKK